MEQHITELHAAINAVTETERPYLVRFVTKNAHRPLVEVLAHWAEDRKGREESAKIEQHRREKVMREYAEITGQSVEAFITGVQMHPATKKVKGE